MSESDTPHSSNRAGLLLGLVAGAASIAALIVLLRRWRQPDSDSGIVAVGSAGSGSKPESEAKKPPEGDSSPLSEFGEEVRGRGEAQQPVSALDNTIEPPEPITAKREPSLPLQSRVVLGLAAGFTVLGGVGLLNGQAAALVFLLIAAAQGFIGLRHPAAWSWLRRGIPALILPLLGVILPTATFALARGERFDTLLLITWIGSLVVWWRIFSDRPFKLTRPRLKFDGVTLALGSLLLLGAATFYFKLDNLPDDMISDHAEYIFDVARVLDGEHWVYFAANSGREPLHLYAGGLVSLLIGGIGFISIKLVSATAGWLTLPALYLLGRDTDSNLMGLLAVLFGATTAWHLIFARLGFRVTLASLATAWLLWLLWRALKSNRRTDFLLAGMLLGLGHFGYTAFRIAPLFVLVALGLRWLAAKESSERRALFGNTVALWFMALMAFMPLLSYWILKPNVYWQRATSLVGTTDAPALDQIIRGFTESLLMFNFGHDPVALNLVQQSAPALLPILGILFVAGLALLLRRAYMTDNVMLLYLPLAFVIFLLPSALALNTPRETPSARRAIDALPVVMLLAGYAGAMLARWAAGLRLIWLRRVGLALVALMIAVSVIWEVSAYARFYPDTYRRVPHREIAAEIMRFARAGNSIENAFVVYRDSWVDVRVIGIWLGSTRYNDWKPIIAEFNAVECERLRNDLFKSPLLIILAPSDNDNLQLLFACFPPEDYAITGNIVQTEHENTFRAIMIQPPS
jgi:hypothetical protein